MEQNYNQPFAMTAENIPLGRQFLIFGKQRSSLVATNVVQKPYNNKLHFEVDYFKILIMFKSDIKLPHFTFQTK